MAGERELVLLVAADPPLGRHDRGVLAHRQAGAGARRCAGSRGRSAAGAACDSARARAALDLLRLRSSRMLRRSSLSARGASEVVSTPPAIPLSICPSAILLATSDRGLEPGRARLLNVVGGRLRRQSRAEHRLAGQVEVAAVLEDRAGDHFAEHLALEIEPRHERVERRSQHVLVGRLRVGAVLAREGDPTAAEDCHAAGALIHRWLLLDRFVTPP